MGEPKKYILYCGQEANFQTRSMLIPYDLIMKCEQRSNDIKILRENAEHNIQFEHKGTTYVVVQLIIQYITFNNGIGTHDQMPFTRITNELTHYADWGSEQLLHLYDKEWLDATIYNVSSKGFNHIVNYCKTRNKKTYKGKSIEIVEGFLVLESTNGKVLKPSVDTVEEMYEKYYGSK
jgi:predicted SprT family Zn-dependent metalloprotease